MAATLHVLRPQTPMIAGFLRVGYTGHRKLLDLHASGRLPFRRFVFDAAHVEKQVELANGLKASGCEIVLDPNFAEMAILGRFSSSAIQALPWADLDAQGANGTRSRSPSFRGGSRSVSAVMGQ